MFRAFLIFSLILTATTSDAQENLKHFKPVMGKLLTFDMREQRLIERRDILLQKEKRTVSEEKEMMSILRKYGEIVTDIWSADAKGCSWYCGGGPYKVIASSWLPAIATNNYKAENIHDLSFKTAWAEGVTGYGIGEYIEYHFEAESPRITQIQIANGYVRSEKAWFENSRVKELKMYVNSRPYAILELKDSKALQRFDVPVLGRNNGKKDWVLRFEIVDVYKGDKYNDVVISELFFGGVDVH